MESMVSAISNGDFEGARNKLRIKLLFQAL